MFQGICLVFSLNLRESTSLKAFLKKKKYPLLQRILFQYKWFEQDGMTLSCLAFTF
jgi:hypothetical protein